MKFYSVVKPGIIFGNIITVCGGFFLGSQVGINILLLIKTLIGMSLVMASGCVLNNVIDRDIDRLMERTKNRVLVRGLISPRVAVVYAIILGILGFLLLSLTINLLTAMVALLGWFMYVVIYSLWLKRSSIYGVAVGGIAGAVPPVVGYCAATNRFDLGAVILFLMLFFWQMPHSYAIAIYRLSDYSAAAIPVLPLKKGIYTTKISILVCTIAFAIVALMPTVFAYTGVLYFIVALVAGLFWVFFAIKGLLTKNDRAWARKMFLISIIDITVLCLMMPIKQ